MVRLRLAFEDSLQHRAQFFIPGAAAKLIDLVPDAFFRRQSKHRVETLVRRSDLEFWVEDEQRFAAWGAGACHLGTGSGRNVWIPTMVGRFETGPSIVLKQSG